VSELIPFICTERRLSRHQLCWLVIDFLIGSCSGAVSIRGARAKQIYMGAGVVRAYRHALGNAAQLRVGRQQQAAQLILTTSYCRRGYASITYKRSEVKRRKRSLPSGYSLFLKRDWHSGVVLTRDVNVVSDFYATSTPAG